MAYIDINVPYLMDIMKTAKLSGREFGNTIGQGEHWAHNAIYRGKSRDCVVDMICRMYGADRAKLATPVPKPNKSTAVCPPAEKPAGNNEILVVIANGIIRVENKLDRLLKALGEEVK